MRMEIIRTCGLAWKLIAHNCMDAVTDALLPYEVK